jgi:alpha-beta hydrolase superfamily lysophospholipase
MNCVAAFHAYQFTHFSLKENQKTPHPTELSTLQKLKVAVLGVENPRPENNKFPTQNFKTVKIQSNKEIEGWEIKTKDSIGTVIIFHGFGGHKSSMLDKADVFLKLGYNVLLIDFMGSGGSEGNQTTIGYFEAEQVKTSYNYVKVSGENNIVLFGTSMGAAAIIKAISDHQIKPSSIILECPFGSMYETVCARFHSMNIPSFPMAGLLVFWGGIENGFWAFDHNPATYAKKITTPTLLLYGEKDERVSRREIDDIFSNLTGEKKLETFPLAGHENYLNKYKEKWIRDVSDFLHK